MKQEWLNNWTACKRRVQHVQDAFVHETWLIEHRHGIDSGTYQIFSAILDQEEIHKPYICFYCKEELNRVELLKLLLLNRS